MNAIIGAHNERSDSCSARTNKRPPITCDVEVNSKHPQNESGTDSGKLLSKMGKKNGKAHTEYDQVISGRGVVVAARLERASRTESANPAIIDRNIHIKSVGLRLVR